MATHSVDHHVCSAIVRWLHDIHLTDEATNCFGRVVQQGTDVDLLFDVEHVEVEFDPIGTAEAGKRHGVSQALSAICVTSVGREPPNGTLRNLYCSDMSGIHEERDRAGSFGTDAERYDRTRPGYPAALIDWLSAERTGAAVDVGCGTGQITRLLRDRGWHVTGVEADPRMASVARCHGLDVDVSTFERWPGPQTEFDLICSAQAWHWIDPTIGFPKAASHLVSGGTLAMIWNSYHHTDDVLKVFHDVYGRLAPQLLEHAVPLGTSALDHEANDAAVQQYLGSDFTALTITVFNHERQQSVKDWGDECLTHSPIALLPITVRDQLLAEQEHALLDAVGSEIQVRYTTRVTSTHRT